MLYGIYPYVVEKISCLFSSGSQSGLRIFFDGNFWRADLHLVDCLDVKSFTLVTLPVSERWKEELVNLVVTILSCVESMPSLSGIIVEDHVALGRALSKMCLSERTIVMRFFDVQWVQRCIRNQFRQRIGGLDPYNVLDFLKFRLANVVNGAAFDKLPLLRQVCILFLFFFKKREGRVCLVVFSIIFILFFCSMCGVRA